MFILLTIVLPTVVYVLGMLKCWRHLGWWARTNHSVCTGNDCHLQYPSIDPECSHCIHMLCKSSAIIDYGWTLLVSLAVWWGIFAVAGILAFDKKFGLTDLNVGFFKPGPIVESRKDKIIRLEREAIEREQRIKKLELEAGIV